MDQPGKMTHPSTVTKVRFLNGKMIPATVRFLNGLTGRRNKRRRKSMLGQKDLSHPLKDDRLSLPVKMR
jgi:hypothetical protein